MGKGKLLSKVPCNDDLFEGGAHRKLAIEISDEIRNDDNSTYSYCWNRFCTRMFLLC